MIVKTHVFGFPRRVLPAGFEEALKKLCLDLGEGDGAHQRAKLPDQKDGRLDIVAWKDFPDRRRGKLIAFGQCATGQDWSEKVTDLPETYHWCRNWMLDSPAVLPIRTFFVPHRIVFKQWLQTNMYGGILFDRCRIGYLTASLDIELAPKLAEWSQYIIQELRSE